MRSFRASLRRAKPLLGTFVEIEASAALSPAALLGATEAAYGAVREIHALMSFHEPGSDVSRLNRYAHANPVTVDRRTWTVLERAARFSRASAGAFDVTVAPHLVAWGFLPRPPNAPPPDPLATYEVIELLDDDRVRFRVPAWIDLGGIAKGYAVDAACAVLRDHGILDYIVNAGGDLAVGECPSPVHVRDPANPQSSFCLGRLAGVAVATSGAYFAAREAACPGRHPIVEPADGVPARDLGSVTVIAADAITADALTKVVAVGGAASESIVTAFGATLLRLPAVGPAGRPASRAGLSAPPARLPTQACDA